MELPKTIEDVVQACSTYLNEENVQFVVKAYEVAKRQHEGQFRKSGDPYIQHPLEIAYILCTLHTGPNTIAAGFLHDVLEDTGMSKEEMAALFNNEVAEIVDGVTKISQLKYMTKSKALAHTHEKLLIAMAKDVRVIIVKLVDRLHNMRTIEFQSEEKKKRIAQETLDLYAPLSHRLGMYRIKAELEDLSFKALQPETYKEIANSVSSKKDERENDIENMHKAIEDILKDNGVEEFEIKGRIKNIYSIYNKMVNKNKTIDDIFDLLALRVIVPSIGECYRVLGLIHSIWTPLPKRFKDYIAVPKANMYQSLHTTVVGPGGKIFEVQIRTKEMDDIAELGIAAHWAYKEGAGYSPEKEQLEITNKLKWYKDLTVYVEDKSNGDLVGSLQEDVFSANVYVFTPSGDVYEFPPGAMPLDFAYRIHSEVGNKCVGAIVNGKIVPLTYQLQTGDVVEIKTSKQCAGPTESWMRLTKTTHAHNKIRTFINKKMRDDFIQRGIEELENVCKNKNYDIKLITDEVAVEMFSHSSGAVVKSLEDLFCEIGKGTISAGGVINKLLGLSDTKLDDETALKQYSEEQVKVPQRKSKNEYGVFVDGLNKATIRMGNCCQPIYGDKIYGYVSKGNGIIVHRKGCPNLQNTSERFINVEWDPSFTGHMYPATIKIIAFDRNNLVADCINNLNNCNVNLISVSCVKNKNSECTIKFKLEARNLDDFEHAVLVVQSTPDVYSVERVVK